MLTESIQQSYDLARKKLLDQAGVQQIARGKEGNRGFIGTASVYQVNSPDFLRNDGLEEEVFGPSSLLVSAKDLSLIHI